MCSVHTTKLIHKMAGSVLENLSSRKLYAIGAGLFLLLRPTWVFSLKVKTIDVKDKHIKLQVWDTGGQEKFRTLTNKYYRGAHAVLLVYDVTDLKSFVHLKDWLREVDEYARDDVVKFIVGNKSDRCGDQVVDAAMAKTFAAKEGFDWIEVSAKTGASVNELCTSVTSKLVDVFDEDNEPLGRVKLSAPPDQRVPQARCCSIA